MPHALVLIALISCSVYSRLWAEQAADRQATPLASQFSWHAPDRGAKVAALIPGRRTPQLTPETLFADWTKAQVERWNKEHPPLPAAEAYQQYAATAPTDAELTADFPVHISPFGRPRGKGSEGPPTQHAVEKADQVLVSYCPFCGSESLSLAFDPKNPYGHA
ncbi:MAG: hypothetical protein GW892_08600, partial [Armatimonadetes bacterium]|nr:hypothetical protein [Armatimonadota bacterium]